ncbi:hypothetical protein FYR46_07010 [Salmonella enterica]|nr:hypothetical protein [Salmonella enterica]
MTSITFKILMLMKDQPSSVLSTDCANNLPTICLNFRFSSHVKAVNGTSSDGFTLLSQLSVDNIV